MWAAAPPWLAASVPIAALALPARAGGHRILRPRKSQRIVRAIRITVGHGDSIHDHSFVGKRASLRYGWFWRVWACSRLCRPVAGGIVPVQRHAAGDALAIVMMVFLSVSICVFVVIGVPPAEAANVSDQADRVWGQILDA